MTPVDPVVEKSKRPLWQGVGFTFLLNLSPILIFPLMAVLWPYIGVTQLLYILPLTGWFKKQGESEFVKGMWIGAGIVFLLNSTCWAAGFAGLIPDL